MHSYIQPVPYSDALYRLFNLGGTVLVEAMVDQDIDIMPASWNSPLDYDKLSVVVDSVHYTRDLIEQSGRFLLAVPGYGIRREVMYLGSVSKNDNANKIVDSKIELIERDDCAWPLPAGCSAWALCEVIEEKSIQTKYDLFLGQIISAWADTRVYQNNHWMLEKASDNALRPIHYVAGRHFYMLGEPFDVQE